MVDDLITKGTDEPYRMFTSRAEHRLHLRIDNADERLTPIAEEIGLATQQRRERFAAKQSQMERVKSLFQGNPGKSAWLRRPESKIEELKPWIREELGTEISAEAELGVLMTVETEIKYAGYMDQQRRQMDRLVGSNARVIPENMAFEGIPGLSREVRERLTRVRPVTLGQAARIPGVTPAAVAILDVYLNVSRETC
jgi:tRNA uridine 5-carboxymethylaminomethyl modification enzyme